MNERDELTVLMLDIAYRHIERWPHRLYHGVCEGIVNGRTELSLSSYGVKRCVDIESELLFYVNKALGRFELYPRWLIDVAHFNVKKESEFKMGRLAWIEDMIAAVRAGEPLPDRPSLPSDFKPRQSQPTFRIKI